MEWYLNYHLIIKCLFLTHFTLQLKGLSVNVAEKKANKILTYLNLFDKKFESIDTLSGGMQRILHLGIAVIGRPKVINIKIYLCLQEVADS